MGLWSFLTGAKATETACNLVEDISSGVDKMFYTEEEQADDEKLRRAAKQKAFDSWIEAMKTTQQESSVRSVTRRIIALSVVFVFLGLIVLGVAVYPYHPTYSAFIFKVIDKIFWIVVSVIGFYFSFEGFNFIKQKK